MSLLISDAPVTAGVAVCWPHDSHVVAWRKIISVRWTLRRVSRFQKLVRRPRYRAVVDEDGGNGGVDVEVVVIAAGDGQVPHPPVMVPRRASADHCHSSSAGGAQVVTVPERGGLDPPVLGEVVEQVPAGGIDDRGLVPVPDSQVVAVGVVMHEHDGNGLGRGLPGLRVGGLDLVPRPELADRDRGAGSQQHSSSAGEGLATARGRTGVRLGVFCGKYTSCAY